MSISGFIWHMMTVQSRFNDFLCQTFCWYFLSHCIVVFSIVHNYDGVRLELWDKAVLKPLQEMLGVHFIMIISRTGL